MITIRNPDRNNVFVCQNVLSRHDAIYLAISSAGLQKGF